jgi:hypothetical protein
LTFKVKDKDVRMSILKCVILKSKDHAISPGSQSLKWMQLFLLSQVSIKYRWARSLLFSIQINIRFFKMKTWISIIQSRLKDQMSLFHNSSKIFLKRAQWWFLMKQYKLQMEKIKIPVKNKKREQLLDKETL